MPNSKLTPPAAKLFHEHQQSVYRRTDRMFGILIAGEWIAGVAAALWISPRAWAGTNATLHPHVIASIALGGVISALPVVLAFARPGHVLTRHIIAISQMLMSALLIHLTGGRIETHFHVFGSLAFLACYRDWRVLVSATIVVILDHLIRGLVWPFSVYGVLSTPIWRSFEHGGWVLFEDVFLIVAIRQSVAEMKGMARASDAKSEAAAELARSQAALRSQTQILESVLASMGDGVIVADSDGRFLLFNPAAEQIVRQGPAETRPEQWTEQYGLYEPESLTPFPVDELPLVKAIRGESCDGVEIFVRHCPEDDGNLISVTGRPLRDASGALLGGVVVFRDITVAKQIEEALHNAKRTAETANRAKTEFLANMSHEIRTPLSSILGFTELLRRGIGSPADSDLYLETISSSGRHLSALIDDILDLSKIEAGRMEFERVRCSPHEIITEVLSILRVRAQDKGLSLECSWTCGVPETICTDPARLRQLLMNIVGNAIKFTERGGVTLLATVIPNSSEPRFVIEVHDSGIGIPLDRVESIFEPFAQADNSITRRFGGTGLGLAISRYIARGLGGEITVQSAMGRGSIFRITLETGLAHDLRILEDPPTEALAPSHGEHLNREVQLASARVLLVEDGESNRQLIRLVLEESGVKVSCAENGLQGLELATREDFDLILMDMQMPVMDGYTATQRLRDRGWQRPIIALTAHAMRGDKEKCMAAGCSGYLSKPIDIDELLRTVAAALENCARARSSSSLDEPNIENAQLTTSESPENSPIASSLPTESPRFRKIVEMFFDRLQNQLEAMKVAHANHDWEELAELAHWLKGAGGTVGFNCFTEPADRLQQLARQRCDAQSASCVKELVDLADRITVSA